MTTSELFEKYLFKDWQPYQLDLYNRWVKANRPQIIITDHWTDYERLKVQYIEELNKDD